MRTLLHGCSVFLNGRCHTDVIVFHTGVLYGSCVVREFLTGVSNGSF